MNAFSPIEELLPVVLYTTITMDRVGSVQTVVVGLLIVARLTHSEPWP